MILTLNTKFEGYTPVQVLGKSISYREAYLAKNSFEQDVVLTVYDMNNLPECFTDGKIPEFELIPQLTNEALPTYIERGDYDNDEISLRWMATKYVGGITLSEFIHSDYVRNEREMLHQFYNLLVAVKELSWRMGGGCCNNISTDNIIVTVDAADEAKWHLVGLNCVSETCKGRATFDTYASSESERAKKDLKELRVKYNEKYKDRSRVLYLIPASYTMKGKRAFTSEDLDNINLKPEEVIGRFERIVKSSINESITSYVPRTSLVCIDLSNGKILESNQEKITM